MAPRKWTGPLGQKLILDVNHLRARTGLSKRKAVAQLGTQSPWNAWEDPETLWQGYKVARRRHGESPPIPTHADESIIAQSTKVAANRPTIDTQSRARWMSSLQEWGKETKRLPACMSVERADGIIKRLIAAGWRWHDQLDQLSVHMGRRIHWNGRQKIKWIEATIDRLTRNPSDWPIPPSRRGRPDVTVGKIESYLRDVGRAHKQDIAAALGILDTTAQTTLCSMERAGIIVREANGLYAPMTEGAKSVDPTDKAILDALADGPATPAELRARIPGKTEAAITAGLHRLKEASKAVLTHRGKYGKYGLAGKATPHVYAGDAIDQALKSGSKTLPELEKVTGKKRGELWAALSRKEAKGEVIKACLITVGQRGRLAAFASAASARP